MRLPFPERVPLRYALYFAVLLCAAQLIQGTPAAFSLCCFLFIIIATLTFNLAGGFTRASGGYVFFYAVLAVIFGIFWKAVIGEPADSNLKQPLLTFQIYVGSITSMLAAVYLSRKITMKRAILSDMITDANMSNASIGCMIVGFFLTVVVLFIPHEGGSILSALNQVNFFFPLAIILGTIGEIRRSGGTRSVNLSVLIAICAIFTTGLVGFSKTGMFTPVLCWLIAAASQRYRVTLYQVLGFLLLAAFMVYYLVPYSEYGRNYKTESLLQNAKLSIDLLSDLQYVRDQDKQASSSADIDRVQAYYDTPQGFFDRMQMISPDDALVNVTENNAPIGFAPIVFYFENLVPHFLWPGKPTFGFGNFYAHEIGMIGEEDTSTGVSFSPSGEAFHVSRWVGVFLVAPLLWIPLFVVFDSLCGDVRNASWGLFALVMFAHIAPEGMLGGVVYSLWYGAIGIAFAAFTATYVTPLLGSVFGPSSRAALGRAVTVRSIPRRLPSAQPSQNTSQ